MTATQKPPIVLVHGTRFSAGQWSPQLAPLGEHFPVTAIDLPGHGTRSSQPWSLASATEIISGAVDSLGHGPAMIVGHSLGGYAALEFARRRPGQVRGLVLAGASAVTSGPWAAPYRLIAKIVHVCRRIGWRSGTIGSCAGSTRRRSWRRRSERATPSTPCRPRGARCSADSTRAR